jgi:hypothetical protein
MDPFKFFAPFDNPDFVSGVRHRRREPLARHGPAAMNHALSSPGPPCSAALPRLSPSPGWGPEPAVDHSSQQVGHESMPRSRRNWSALPPTAVGLASARGGSQRVMGSPWSFSDRRPSPKQKETRTAAAAAEHPPSAFASLGPYASPLAARAPRSPLPGPERWTPLSRPSSPSLRVHACSVPRTCGCLPHLDHLRSRWSKPLTGGA